MKVTDLEKRIDREYTYEDVQEITTEGIRLSDGFIRFEESMLQYRYSLESGLGGRAYVGERNCLTDPPYMRFVVGRKALVILFPFREDFYKMADEIRSIGFETYDRS